MPLFHKIVVSLDRKAGALAAVFVIISLMGTQLARAEDVFTDQDVFKDLQGRWSFDRIEADGSVADLSGNGRDLTLFGSPGWGGRISTFYLILSQVF